MYCFDVFHHVGTPLYCDRSEYSAEKFGYVVKEVLLPLALDYHVRSRTNEVDAVASAEVTNLNGDVYLTLLLRYEKFGGGTSNM